MLDLSGARLSVVRENLETALKERRTQFDQYLLAEKKKMDSFRLRDVREVLSLDDLKEKVTTVDALMDTLEVIYFFNCFFPRKKNFFVSLLINFSFLCFLFFFCSRAIEMQ